MMHKCSNWIYSRLPSTAALVRLTLFLIIFSLVVIVVMRHIITTESQQRHRSSLEGARESVRPLDIPVWKKSVFLQQQKIPRTKTEDGLIPKIIHQAFVTPETQKFTTPLVFTEYKAFIESCVKFNPDWQYYLWTNDQIVNFIEDKYPFFLPMYKALKIPIQRADSIRYMILHHFGGIYIDMDIECIKPFYPSLSNLTAFVGQEAKEHAVLLYGKNYTAVNGVMGSVPGHPFFLRLVFAMMENGKRDSPDVLASTGPLMVTKTLEKWWNSKFANLHTVAMLEPTVFCPIIDDTLHNFSRKCEKFLNQNSKPDPSRSLHIHKVSKQLCLRYAERKWKSDLTGSDTVGRHVFLHLGWRLEKREERYVDVRSIVGEVTFYSKSGR